MSDTDAIAIRLAAIYDDLAANVTNIYGRQDLHFVADLVYHSPISFKFGNRIIKKGYPEALVIGDTRTGKTQCIEALSQHYGLGVMAQSETMSLAGLIGGVEQQIEKTWGITWGKLPQNNRRLVILDEASGLKTEDIGKLSSIRSSGVATIEKIRNQSTEAKTRLLWLSNPRESMTVNQFSSGIDIIETLCPAPEDVARFDVAIIVSKDDVDPKMIRRTAKNVKHVYTSKLCHDLVLWCWTRSPQEVIISEETKEACFDEAEKLSSKYSSDFPLVIGAEQRLKMARLAVALAGRLYSTDDGKRLLVLPCHVRYISDFLDRLYSNKHFGYDNWSVTRTLGSTIINISIIEKFMEKIKRLGCLKMLELKKVCLRDLEETMGITSDEARTHIAMLYTNNAIRKGTGIYYTKSPQFNDMLREFGHKNIDTPEREF